MSVPLWDSNNHVKKSFMYSTSKMKLQVKIKVFLTLLRLSHCGDTPSLQVFHFGSNDKLGTDGPEPEGGQDYILWESKDLPEGAFPSEFSVCFNMKYETMDYWSTGQKTILRIFKDGMKTFWLRVNNSPPRGTMILNSGTLWSGGLGSYR